MFITVISFSACMDLSMSNDNFTTEEVNDFEIMKIGLNNMSTTDYYEYICSDDTNHINIGGPIDDGLVVITVTDDKNNIVFHQKLEGYTTYDQDVIGVSGIWTIQLEYKKARGNLNMKLSNQ